jgi:HEAT repeat protein
VRAAAVRALARLDRPGVVAEVGRYATSDPDVTVQQAAIDALGASKRVEAYPS